LASDPLRNACNAERPIPIQMELSLTEGRQLQHWLTAALQMGGVDDDLHQDLARVSAKLSDAADQAVRLVQCPVCHEWFVQGLLGRSASYCGPACKQKAYRQRMNAHKRQVPTANRRD
jgi:hypothetical protein